MIVFIGKRIRTWSGSGESQEPEPDGGVAPMSMDSVFMQMSACRHTGDSSWKICAAICCGLQLAVERLERLSGGRLAYRMKTPWRDVS